MILSRHSRLRTCWQHFPSSSECSGSFREAGEVGAGLWRGARTLLCSWGKKGKRWMWWFGASCSFWPVTVQKRRADFSVMDIFRGPRSSPASTWQQTSVLPCPSAPLPPPTPAGSQALGCMTPAAHCLHVPALLHQWTAGYFCAGTVSGLSWA